MIFLCYDKCQTCKKAKKFLDESGAEYTPRDIKTKNPTKTELKKWQKKSGLTFRRFFNTSGRKYRELSLKDRLPDMSDDEMLALLSSDGMLVKLPILIDKDFVLVGFMEEEWKEKIK